MPVNSFENYPMSWKPVIDRNSDTPLYISLADTLKNDILEGRLTPGTKLPPQRELADYLEAISTVENGEVIVSVVPGSIIKQAIKDDTIV